AGTQTHVHEIALARIVFGIHVSPQPLPGADQSRHFEVVGAVDPGAIMSSHQGPLSLVLDPAIARRLAFLPALPAQAVACVAHTLDVRVLVERAHAVLVALEGGR